jgi:hypothetical protein
MELTLFLSARNIVSHIVTSDLKIFREYCYTLFLHIFPYNDAYSIEQITASSQCGSALYNLSFCNT